MEQTHDTNWERSLEQMARRFEYPPTPDIVAAIGRPAADDRRRGSGRLAWALAVVVIVAAVLFAVPQTRAALLSLFARVGAIEIFIDDAQPAPAPTAEPTTPTGETATHSLTLHDFGRPVTLAEAEEAIRFPLLLPPELGEPDEVYIHDSVDWRAATLVWRGENDEPLSLTQIRAPQFAMKMAAAEDVKHLQIDGRPAVFLQGPHRLQLLMGTDSLLIDSNVLIWAVDGVTYRLEGDLSEAEMTSIMESLLSSLSAEDTATPATD